MKRPHESTTWEDESFEELDLTGMDLRDREFSRCVFRGCKLPETKWLHTRLEDCVFEGCDLTRADPALLSLREVQFRRCKLMGIDWSHVGSFPAVRFEDCNLHYTTVIEVALRKTHFVRCTMVEANFVKSDFVESVFEDCQFTGARFDECDLRKTSFAGARDLFVDPTKNNARGAKVPIESAALLAAFFGMHVIGYGEPKEKARKKAK